jgi:hypothetical protein
MHFPAKQLCTNDAAWVTDRCDVLLDKLGVFQWDNRDKCFIFSGLLFTMHFYGICLCNVEHLPGNVILCVCKVSCFQILTFELAVCIWGHFSWTPCSTIISHFVQSCLIFLTAPLLFTRSVKPYFSEGVAFCLVFPAVGLLILVFLQRFTF